MAKRPHLYWTQCAAHRLDLILADIGNQVPKVKKEEHVHQCLHP